MPNVAVAGGSRKELRDMVRSAKEELGGLVRFTVYDCEPNIDTEQLWEYVPCENEEDMVRQAVKSVAKKEADILFKGDVQTHALLKEVLKKEHALRAQKVLSHVAWVQLPALGRSLLLTDSAMNIQPGEEELAVIIENAISVGINIGITRPKVALLSAAENVNEKMASSVHAARLTERFASSPNAVVYGPLSLDLALSKEAVERKRFEGPIQGDADILVVPSIEAGNLLYKSLVLFAGASIGGTIAGAAVPIVVTSRSDSVKSKLHALKFALMQTEDTGGGPE